PLSPASPPHPPPSPLFPYTTLFRSHAQSRATARFHNNIIHTYAGGGPDGIPALSANIPVPTAVATDAAGNIYVATPGGDRVFIVDRKSTRLNSSHQIISYAVFCLKK